MAENNITENKIVETESTETKMSSHVSAKDYKMMIDMIKEMDEQYNALRDIYATNIMNSYGIKASILDDIIVYTNESIDNAPYDELCMFLSNYIENKNDLLEVYGEKVVVKGEVDDKIRASIICRALANKLKENAKYSMHEEYVLNKDKEDNDNNTEEATEELTRNTIVTDSDDNTYSVTQIIRNIMKDIKESSLAVLNAKVEAEKLKKESESIINEYLNYMSSSTVQEKRKMRIEAMKDAYSQCTDNDEKIKIKKMIDTLESSQNLSFLLNRISLYKDKEIDNIVKSYFDEKSSAYILEKYNKKISKFNFDPRLYKYFFNIEENFLEEKYHVFNNLFLFIYMRYVSYADPYDKTSKLYVQSLTSELANLIYHRFDSNETEQVFLDFIKSLLDKFMPYYDKFNSDNITHPKHPTRVEADTKHEKKRKDALITHMNQLHIEGYDENSSADELQNFYNEKMRALIDEQVEKKKESEENQEIKISDDVFGGLTEQMDKTETNVNEDGENHE